MRMKNHVTYRKEHTEKVDHLRRTMFRFPVLHRFTCSGRRMRGRYVISLKNPVKIIFILAIIGILYTAVFDVWRSQNLIKKPVELQYVVVHIDLKGAPPKLEYLISLLPMFKEYGVNGLLLEYEDMFPFEGTLVNLSAKNCYKRSELKAFVETAVKEGIEVIPLIQTFGHLEYALKLEEFMELREEAAYPESICPSNIKSRTLVIEMLKQVMNFHATISPLKHIHVGCDEVFHMNSCRLCKKKGFSNEALFLDYVKYISDSITELNVETTVLIWDDMLRNTKLRAWEKTDQLNNVEPVYWAYNTVKKFPYIDMMNYHKKFKKEWVATAFKGADGRTAIIPDLYERLMNHFSWLTHMQTARIPGEYNVYTFKGIILTGWSRYSHLDQHCELLPVAMPSLVLNLRMIRAFRSSSVNNQSGVDELYRFYLSQNDKYFSCGSNSKVVPSNEHVAEFCSFDESKIFNLLNKLNALTSDVKSFLQLDAIPVLVNYFRSDNVNKTLLARYFDISTDLLSKIHSFKTSLSRVMEQYYDDGVIKEYLGNKLYNVKKKLSQLIQILKTCLIFYETWNERI